jgi:hypothetical protein
VSADATFQKPVVVPDGFLGSAIPVPHPSGGALFLKLRDDPQVVNPTTLTARQLPPPPSDTDRSDSRQSALSAGAAPVSTPPADATPVTPASAPQTNARPVPAPTAPPASTAPANAPAANAAPVNTAAGSAVPASAAPDNP